MTKHNVGLLRQQQLWRMFN